MEEYYRNGVLELVEFGALQICNLKFLSTI